MAGWLTGFTAGRSERHGHAPERGRPQAAIRSAWAPAPRPTRRPGAQRPGRRRLRGVIPALALLLLASVSIIGTAWAAASVGSARAGVLLGTLAFVGLSTSGLLFAWAAHTERRLARLADTESDAGARRVEGHGRAFAGWFAAQQLGWSALGLLLASLLLLVTRGAAPDLMLAGVGGLLAVAACALVGAGSALRPLLSGQTTSLAICWQSAIPHGARGLAPRAEALLLLPTRLAQVRSWDAEQPQPLLRKIVQVREAARLGRAGFVLDVRRAPGVSLTRETGQRTALYGALWLVGTLIALLALWLGLIGPLVPALTSLTGTEPLITESRQPQAPTPTPQVDAGGGGGGGGGQQGSGEGQGAGSGAGGSGSGQGEGGAGQGQGSGSSQGTGQGQGAGSGSAAGQGQGEGNSGQGQASGQGQGAGSGQGQGPGQQGQQGQGQGAGQGQSNGQGEGQGQGDGQGQGNGQGQSQGDGRSGSDGQQAGQGASGGSQDGGQSGGQQGQQPEGSQGQGQQRDGQSGAGDQQSPTQAQAGGQQPGQGSGAGGAQQQDQEAPGGAPGNESRPGSGGSGGDGQGGPGATRNGDPNAPPTPPVLGAPTPVQVPSAPSTDDIVSIDLPAVGPGQPSTGTPQPAPVTPGPAQGGLTGPQGPSAGGSTTQGTRSPGQPLPPWIQSLLEGGSRP